MGNICRSPTLEGCARDAAERAGRAGQIRFDSAGTGGWHAGEAPDPRAVRVAARHGVDLSALRARQVEADDFHRFDVILCADRDNLAWLRRQSPRGGRAGLALALDWTGLRRDGEVPDPYYGGDADFEHVFALAQAAAQALLRRLPPQA